MAFSIFMPAIIRLEKEMKEKERKNQQIEYKGTAEDFCSAILHVSGGWVTGLISCAFHAIAAIGISRAASMAADRAIFLYSIQPKRASFYGKKILKRILPECLGRRVHIFKNLNAQESAYLWQNQRIRCPVQRVRDSIMRRGLFHAADFLSACTTKFTSIQAFLPAHDETKTIDKKKVHPLLFCVCYHGGALFVGSIGAVAGHIIGKSDGEYWAEFFVSMMWTKMIDRFICM